MRRSANGACGGPPRRARPARGMWLAGVLAMAPAPSVALADDVSAEAAGSGWAELVEEAAAPEAFASELRTLRLEHREQRRREGFVLLSWGLASAVAGVAIAVAGRQQQPGLAAGVTTAGFGAVDALLSVGLLDLSGEARAAALAGRAGPYETFDDVRDAAVAAQLGSGQGFAINAGLDVFYMATGVLMYVLGRQTAPNKGWLRGAGLATAVQGLFLFGFDLFGWIRANRRASALQGLGR